MSEAIIIALIGGLCGGVPSVIATLSSNRSNNKVLQFKIEELDKKVEKHNNVIERMTLVEHDQQTIWKRIDEIKEKIKL